MNNTNKELTAEIAAQGIPEAVLQKCLERPLGSVLLSRLYTVFSGWETEELKMAKGIFVAATANDLETAFKAQEQREILLLKSANVTLDALKGRLEMQGNPKRIFIER